MTETNPYLALTDVDAEQAVLNLLLDPFGRNDLWRSAVDVFRRNLRADDFGSGRPHGVIFQAIMDLADEGGDPDFALVADRVPAEQRKYLASLVGDVFLPSYGGPMATHAAMYACRIRDLAVKRRALKAMNDSAVAFMDPKVTAQECIQQAREALEFATAGAAGEAGIYEITDISDSVYDLYENGAKRGWSTGWANLDEYYRPYPGEWTLVTGIPSHGKSAWLNALMVNMAKASGGHFAVCSPETQPLRRHAANLARLWTGKPFDDGPTPRMDMGELVKAMEWEYEHFTFVLPHERKRSLAGVLALMETVLQRRELMGIVIDPWNELDHTRPNNVSMTDFVSSCLTQLRNFARRYQVHVWLVAHPTVTRLQKDPKTGKYPVPRPYDVSDSSHWFAKADNCLAVYREDATQTVQLHVQKVRFDANGETGVVEFAYDRPTGQYHEHYSGRNAA